MLRKLTILSALFSVFLGELVADDRRYQNYGNPTEYTFSAPIADVLAILQKAGGRNGWWPLGGAYYDDEGKFGFGVYDYYTDRYWSGRREKSEEVNPPEAGRIGTIQCHFSVHATPKGELKTLVSVTADMFEQQVGRRYRMFPHFQKGPVFIKVNSDTYFEYLFLTKLGGLLGEKDMPAIKGEETEHPSKS
jgi:hypothetical protein